MKRLSELKTLLALLLVVAISSVFVACGDDDEPTTIDKKLLIGKKWELVKSVVNGKEKFHEFNCAEKHGYILFKADGKLVNIYYPSDCKEERGSEDTKWELSGNTLIRITKGISERYSDGKLIYKKTTIEKLYSTIKTLTNTELVLEYFKITEDGKEKIWVDEDKDGKQDKMTAYYKRVE